MISRKTVFIVGAGASQEVGLPVGDELAKKIAQLLTFERRIHEPTIGNSYFLSAMQCQSRESNDITAYHQAAEKISRGITTVKSIDNFMNIHSNDKYIAACGKAAIAYLILSEEKKSKIYVDNLDSKARINRNRLTETWYHKLGEALVTGRHADGINDIFSNISIVCFNYDRTIEQFLAYFISDAYALPLREALNIVGSLKILRPYGSLGPLPGTKSNGKGQAFGGEIYERELFFRCERIKTYHEQVDDKDTMREIRTEISSAELVVFLGFGFHSQNMNLIDPGGETNIETVIASAYGISDPNSDVVRKSIYNTFAIGKTPKQENIIVRNNLKCAELFDEYSRLIDSPPIHWKDLF